MLNDEAQSSEQPRLPANIPSIYRSSGFLAHTHEQAFHFAWRTERVPGCTDQTPTALEIGARVKSRKSAVGPVLQRQNHRSDNQYITKS